MGLENNFGCCSDDSSRNFAGEVKWKHCGVNSAVECQFSKLKVTGSNPVRRSKISRRAGKLSVDSYLLKYMPNHLIDHFEPYILSGLKLSREELLKLQFLGSSQLHLSVPKVIG